MSTWYKSTSEIYLATQAYKFLIKRAEERKEQGKHRLADRDLDKASVFSFHINQWFRNPSYTFKCSDCWFNN